MLPDQPRRIVISNVYPDDNRGGAALTTAAIDTARRAFPGCHLSLIAAQGYGAETSFRHTRAAHPGIEILPPVVMPDGGRLDGARASLRSLRLLIRPTHSQSATVQRIRNADLVLSRGGVLFAGSGGLRRTLSLGLTALPLVLASAFDVPVVIFGGTVGRIDRRSSRSVNRWILRRATLVLVRDPRSAGEAKALGLDPLKVIQVPDGVLGTDAPTHDECHVAAEQAGLAGAKFGAVTVVPIRGSAERNRRLLRNLVGFIQRVLDSETVERVAVVVQVDGAIASDAPISAALVDLVSDERVVLVREDWAPTELMALYGAARFVVGCRLHSTVFSLIGGTPAFVIPMSGAKSEGLFEGLGLERFIVPSPDFEPAVVADAVAEAVAEGERLREQIGDIVSSARSQVRGSATFLRSAARGEVQGFGSSRSTV